jgi:predicted ATPase with chaperone activity
MLSMQIRRYVSKISGPLLDRILKVSRTLADLERRESISTENVSGRFSTARSIEITGRDLSVEGDPSRESLPRRIVR